MLTTIALKRTLLYRIARRAYHFRQSDGFRRLRQAFRKGRNSKILRDYLAGSSVAKLQIGSGPHLISGWLNSEYLPDNASQYHLDATRPFEFPTASFEYVFSEHMIEHIPLVSGINMLMECHRILKPGGRIRVSTPPLEFLLDLMRQPTADHISYLEWHKKTWLPTHPLPSSATVLNDFMRNWGHLFIYDEPTLRMALEQAGFSAVQRQRLNDSDDPQLRNLENERRMPPGMLALSTMTLEAVRD